MMTREEAEKELIAMLEEAEGGPSYSIEEVDAYMRELLHPKNQIYLTGDTHGQFERIISFCERQQVQPESTFIILGDVGLNYYGDRRDNRVKDNLTKIPITFFMYEEILAFKRAAEKLGLSKSDIEKAFYLNAKNLIDGARKSIYGE